WAIYAAVALTCASAKPFIARQSWLPPQRLRHPATGMATEGGDHGHDDDSSEHASKETEPTLLLPRERDRRRRHVACILRRAGDEGFCAKGAAGSVATEFVYQDCA